MSTATPTSTAQLLDWLVQYQFIRATQAEEFRRSNKFPDGHALAKELIQRGWLTPYQANQILQGRGADLVLGGCRLLERLGEGSMGQVYKAWNQRLERIVAIKMIHKDHVASAKAHDRFAREMEAAGKLDHPNIVLLRYCDEIDSRPFMVMEYIDGTDLARLVKSKGPLPIPEAVEYIRQAALGMQHAFERGVIHRDIKPHNLLLTKASDGKPLVKILDFGLARYESEREGRNRLTMMGSILGTVDYIAPEQAEDARKADIRADIFSLGCSLFFLLTGKPPYPGNTVVEKVTARLLDDAPGVRTARPEVPPALEAVLKKMMARKPDDRYMTPLEAALALKPFAPAQDLAFNSGMMRLPPRPDADIPTALVLPPQATPALPSGPDPLAFSNSNHDLTTAQMLDRARNKSNTMSRGSEAMRRLIANKIFLLACGGSVAVLILVVLVLALAR